MLKSEALSAGLADLSRCAFRAVQRTSLASQHLLINRPNILIEPITTFPTVSAIIAQKPRTPKNNPNISQPPIRATKNIPLKLQHQFPHLPKINPILNLKLLNNPRHALTSQQINIRVDLISTRELDKVIFDLDVELVGQDDAEGIAEGGPAASD